MSTRFRLNAARKLGFSSRVSPRALWGLEKAFGSLTQLGTSPQWAMSATRRPRSGRTMTMYCPGAMLRPDAMVKPGGTSPKASARL